MTDQRIDDHTSREPDREPEPCARCDGNGFITDNGPGEEEFDDCHICDGTGYKPECKCKGLGIVPREDYDWAWVDCPDCEEK